MKYTISLITSLFLLSFPSWAQTDGGFFIEPGITYQQSDGDINWPDPFGSSSSEVKGFGAMLRLGGHASEMIFIAVDGRYGIPELETSVTNSKVDSEEWNYGPSVGVQMPEFGLRAWGTYVADGQLDPDSDNGFDVRFQDARGFRVGAGLHYKVISVNVEYQDIEYEEMALTNAGSITFNSDTDNVNMEDQAWILSVSMPFAL